MYFVSFIAKNLTRRPVRSALTVLGLAVAVGSMIALLGITTNFRDSLQDTFVRRRVDLVVIAGGVADQLSSEVDEAVVEKVRGLDGVEAVDAALVDLTEMQTRDPRDENDVPPSKAVLVQGWLPENFGFEEMEMVAGRVLTPADAGQFRLILGSKIAAELKKSPGDTLTILRQKFEIIGIFKTHNVYETGGIITLLKDYQDLSGRKKVVTGFSLRVKKTSPDPDADVEAVRQRILGLTDIDGKPIRLSAERPQKYLDDAIHLKMTGAMAWMVSAIAVLIGVIGMLNTMVMSVLERTQEIGILRAVGWSRWRVVRMVLGEAVLLGLAAAAVGTLGAVVVTHLLALSPAVSGFIDTELPVGVIGQGVAVTVLIGLIGGAYPAIRAARLLPTEALRHD